MSTGELGYQVIQLGGESAAIVPLAELRRLQALERLASSEAMDEAEIEAATADYDQWIAAGSPGVLTHAEVAASLLDPYG
jgi:hypothetical protein